MKIIKHVLVIALLSASALLASQPAQADVHLFNIEIKQPPPHFEGRWYGRHEGHEGWWRVEHGRWREERHERRYYGWRR